MGTLSSCRFIPGCVCPLHAACVMEGVAFVIGNGGGVRAGYVTHFSGGGCGVTHRFSCLEFSRGDGGHIPLYCSEEYTQIYSNMK